MDAKVKQLGEDLDAALAVGYSGKDRNHFVTCDTNPALMKLFSDYALAKFEAAEKKEMAAK